MSSKIVFPKDVSEFDQGLKNIVSAVDEMLDTIAEVPDVPQKSVYEAMRYSLLAGGKRLRPVLTAAAAQMLGGSLNDALIAGCALECIHTYSLIHDDLPCMDNDDLRRGKPTCHKAFPENIALLAGDGLLNRAFEILSDKSAFESVDSKTALILIACLSRASGVQGMIGGQVVDLESENRNDVTLERLQQMHRGKTGAMIEAAALLGAVISGYIDENAPEYRAVSEFAQNLGMAFQIKDDILDVSGDEAVLGKPVGSDEAEGKNTFVTLLGLENAEAKLNEYTDAAKSALDIFGDSAWFLKELADRLISRDN